MSQISDLEHWKILLEKISPLDKTNVPQVFKELESLFSHLKPQAAPRLQREFEACTIRTDELLERLFDEIDLSDRPILCAFLRMLISFGYFRLAQITYHVEEPHLDSNPIYVPNFQKCKWYDMCPLLPKAGSLGWKGLMNSGLVREEKDFLQVCLKLLTFKLHYCSVSFLLSCFQDKADIIKRNGKKAAEKLFEIIKDVAYSDDCMMGLDTSLFNLLSQFLDEAQLDEVLDAIILDLFKPFMQQKPVQGQELVQLYELTQTHIMNQPHLQDKMFLKLLEHLKTNVIRRKRRHSVEAGTENGNITLESLIELIYDGEKLLETLNKTVNVQVCEKSLQSKFVSHWIQVIDRTMPMYILSSKSSMKLLITCSVLIVATSEMINDDLIEEITSMMTKIVQNASNNTFYSLDPPFLIELTKVFSEKTQLLSTYGSPIESFYKSYLNRYLKHCVMRNVKAEVEKFTLLITFVCDKNLDKVASHLLQCVCVHELANLPEGLKTRSGNKVMEAFLDSARLCGKRLYKFILRNSPLKNESSDEDYEEMDISCPDESLDRKGSEIKKVVVMSALMSVLKIAIIRQDQEILDSYSELLLKLYSAITIRFEQLMTTAQNGTTVSPSSLDPHLSDLLDLYIRHQDLIKGYLNYDLIEQISSHLVSKESPQLNGYVEEDSGKSSKKLIYNDIKSKLTALEDRVKNSAEVYHTIINKQYTSAVDQTIGSFANIKKEKSCFHNYQHDIRTFRDVSATIVSNCDLKTYKRILEYIVQQLEHCDPLDHPRVLYTLLTVEFSIPRCENSPEAETKSGLFKDILPLISCSLSRISKSVESGPSIHAFTKSGSHKSNKAIQCCTYASCIKVYTLIFLRYPLKISNSFMTDAMQLCVSSNLLQYSTHSARLYKFFIQLASAISGLLKSIGIGRRNDNSLRSILPIFLTVFSNLIRCLISASDRQKLEVLPMFQSNGHSNIDAPEENIKSATVSETFETQLELLATDVARILNDLSFLRVRLVDFAPHLISAYIKDIQRASCPDFVKLRLNEGIFRIFNLIDAHQKERQEEVIEAGIQRKTRAGRASGSLFEMIHARLDQASREIFRDMHDDYNRFHRYQGKI